MKEHKHAEVLRAIADGKEVEWKQENEFEWYDQIYYNPLSNPDFSWRIKPEPKPPIVIERCYYLYQGTIFTSSDKANIRFTFDPDTKLPIKVELI